MWSPVRKGWLERSPVSGHRLTLIWLHGLSSSPVQSTQVVQLCCPVSVKIVAPEAPSRSVSALRGRNTLSWYNPKELDMEYDMENVDPEEEDDIEGLSSTIAQVHALVEEEAKLIESKYIVLGGSGLGGCVALAAALSCPTPLSSVFLMNSAVFPFMCTSEGYLHPSNSKTSVVALNTTASSQGDAHEIIPLDYAKESFSALKNHRGRVSWEADATDDGHSSASTWSQYAIEKLASFTIGHQK